jgi:transposase-like protein
MSTEVILSNGETRHNYTAEEKVMILREHLLERQEISAVCKKHGMNPTVFYRWQKEFFENGAAAFQKAAAKPQREQEMKIEKLEARLAKKDAVISELMEEHLKLKKTLGVD